MTSFAMSEGRKLRCKVRAVVTDDMGRILLIRPYGYEPDCWTLPGGGVEAGETMAQAASRELQEELGLSHAQTAGTVPLNIRSEFIYSDNHKAKRGLDHDGQLTELFHCRLSPGTVIRRQVEEIEAVGWFTRDEALVAFKVAAQRELFERCLGRLDENTGKDRAA
ncbi:MAG: NUDIX hydrolase [Rhizobium sp.]|nr:NUDIX hydrolase [Rhizobium sp.]